VPYPAANSYLQKSGGFGSGLGYHPHAQDSRLSLDQEDDTIQRFGELVLGARDDVDDVGAVAADKVVTLWIDESASPLLLLATVIANV
jgi:hypothetical protein